MGTDAPEQLGFKMVPGNNVYIIPEPDSKEETTRLFKKLSTGEQLSMDLQDMFWGAYYGTCTDQSGTRWMFNYQNKKIKGGCNLLLCSPNTTILHIT